MGQLVVNGLALGSIYALVALGLLLIFNTVQIVNFAQGQLLMLGAFIGISCAVTHELPVALSWAVTMVAMALVGFVFMILVYFPLRGRPAFLVILTTIAMGIVLENLALIIWRASRPFWRRWMRPITLRVEQVNCVGCCAWRFRPQWR